MTISGGITNTLYKASVDGDSSVLVRVYGLNTEVLIDRENELQHMEILSEHGFGAKVLGSFANGRLETFLDSRPLEPDEMGHPSVIPKIAQQLADFHNVPSKNSKRPQLFVKLKEWMTIVESISFSDPNKQQTFTSSINIEALRADVEEYPSLLDAHPFPVVFCHNDLLSGNVLLLRDDDAPFDLERSHITLIDFEYSGWSYRGFDIANHFCEYAGLDCDFAKGYPTIEQQRQFCSAYLEYSQEKGNVVDHPTVEELMKETMLFAVLSHLHWGIWGIVQARYSSIDFDFLSYAILRIKHYLMGRPAFLKALHK